MTKDCERFAETLASQDASEHDWEEHLTSCPTCRNQLESHQLLGLTLQDPQTIAFPSELMERLHAPPGVAPPEPPGARRRRAIIAGYAVSATLISVWILLSLDWPSILPRGFGVVSAVVAILALLLLSMVCLGSAYSAQTVSPLLAGSQRR